MKTRILAAVALFAAVAIFGGTFGSGTALAACPAPGTPAACAGDHSWSVALSSYATDTATNVDVTLALGKSTAPTSPFPTAFFNEATTSYTGIVAATLLPVNYGSQIGSIEFDIQTSNNATLLASNNINLTTGQPPRCGEAGTDHVSITAVTTPIFAANKSAAATTVSSAPNPARSPYTFDQEEDLAAGGVPLGVTQQLDWYPNLLLQLGAPDSIVVSRGYAIAKVTPQTQTTVSFLNLSLSTGNKQVTVLGNPIAEFSARGQAVSTCPPFQSVVHTQGNGSTNLWDCSSDYFGAPVAGCAGTLAGTGMADELKTSAIAATYDYEIAISTGLNLDGDAAPSGAALWNAWDNCTVDANSTQADPNSNGIGTACKGGGAVWTNLTAGATTNAGFTCDGSDADHTAVSFVGGGPAYVFAKCQDADQDGVLNSIDNCPLTLNADQVSSLKDGIGDACRPAMAFLTLPPTNGVTSPEGVPGTGVGYPTETVAQDFCNQEQAIGGAGALAAYCVTATMAIPFVDSNANAQPDFLQEYTTPGTITRHCLQDHKQDSNFDGYSDSDQGTPASLGALCPTLYPAAPADPLGFKNPYPSSGSLGTNTQISACLGRNKNGAGAVATGYKIAKADVNANGIVNILDLSAVAAPGTYLASNYGLDSGDRRWEMDQNMNGVINILDLSQMANPSVYLKSVPAC